MSKLSPKKLITPQSILIEETALQLAAAYYEIGRSKGLVSRYKDPKSYAKKYIKNFIPKAVETLMDMLANPSTPANMKETIYDAFMERTNDEELSNSGIPVFKNDVPFKSSKHVPEKPIIVNTKNKARKPGLEDLDIETMLSSVEKKPLKDIQ